MRTKDLIIFMNQSVIDYREMRQYSAARVCNATLNKLIEFCGRDTMTFNALTKEWLKGFEEYLKQRLADNTVSTYLRMLQAVYNKAVYEKLTPFDHSLFKKVFKGRVSSQSRALAQQEIQAVVAAPQKWLSKRATRTRDLFVLMFFLQGLPFVDLVHLRHSNLQGNRLTYRRHKTGRQLVVTVEPQAMAIIERYRSMNPDSPYLFPFLTGKDKEAFLQYESALRQFNSDLKQLGVLLGLSIPLTSYCARHTWASFANCCDIDKKLISEGMGHSSIMVTEIYFKAHEVGEIRKMNQQVIAYALKCV